MKPRSFLARSNVWDYLCASCSQSQTPVSEISCCISDQHMRCPIKARSSPVHFSRARDSGSCLGLWCERGLNKGCAQSSRPEGLGATDLIMIATVVLWHIVTDNVFPFNFHCKRELGLATVYKLYTNENHPTEFRENQPNSIIMSSTWAQTSWNLQNSNL